MALVFDFKNSNTKSWFRNNLGKLLQRRLEIRLAGKKVYIYDNSGESLLEVYRTRTYGYTGNSVTTWWRMTSLAKPRGKTI
jgi:hypothetical protein